MQIPQSKISWVNLMFTIKCFGFKRLLRLTVFSIALSLPREDKNMLEIATELLHLKKKTLIQTLPSYTTMFYNCNETDVKLRQ